MVAEQKKRMARQLWLTYFNGVLFEKGVITAAERNQMSARIETMTGDASGMPRRN